MKCLHCQGTMKHDTAPFHVDRLVGNFRNTIVPLRCRFWPYRVGYFVKEEVESQQMRVVFCDLIDAFLSDFSFLQHHFQLLPCDVYSFDQSIPRVHRHDTGIAEAEGFNKLAKISPCKGS